MTADDDHESEGERDEPAEVAAAREEVVEAMARGAEVYGIKGSYGRLYGTLYFADGALSLDELVERSGYAKSTVSTAMSAMERFHLVRRRSIPGEGKKAYFEVERDLWYAFQQFLDQQVRREVDVMTRALEDAESRLEAAEGEAAEHALERVRELQRVYRRGEQAIDLLTSQRLERLSELVGRLRGE
jgi:DNA-binding transcriptional regulator GbsR (MarR family)